MIARNPNTMFTFTMPEAQADRVFALVKSQIAATKNWMATAVERGDLGAAQQHVAELRALEELFARFNIDAKYEIAFYSDKPLVTERIVNHYR